MAYKSKRTQLVKNEIKFEDGSTLEYSWRPSHLVTKINEHNNQLIRIEDDLNKSKGNPAELGEKMWFHAFNIVALVLGEEKTQEYFSKFDDDKIDFVDDVTDFITQEIMPIVDKYSKDKNKKAKKYRGK